MVSGQSSIWHTILDVGTAKCFKAVLVPAGCVGTICGVKLSPALSDFLNFPNLNLLMCGLVADCGNPAYIAGGGGQVNFTTSLGYRCPHHSSASRALLDQPIAVCTLPC